MKNPISIITSNRHLIRISLSAAVAVGIIGSTYISSPNPDKLKLGTTLRKVSIIIFLVVTALLAVHTLFVARGERVALSKLPPLPFSIYRSAAQRFAFHIGRGSLQGTSFGAKRGTYILCLIVVFLLIREIYLTATINTTHQSEASWYPLAALPELLAVTLFGVPGLVPEKREMIALAHSREKNIETTELV